MSKNQIEKYSLCSSFVLIEEADVKQFNQPGLSVLQKGCLHYSYTVQQRAKCKLHCDSRVYHALSLLLSFSSSLPDTSLHLVFYTSHTQTFTNQASYCCEFHFLFNISKGKTPSSCLKMFHVSPSASSWFAVKLIYSHGASHCFQHGQFNVHSCGGQTRHSVSLSLNAA